MKRKTVLFLAFSLLLFGCKDNDKNNISLFIGSYSKSVDEGISIYNFNQATGEAVRLAGVKGVENPSYLAISDDKKSIYAVAENGPENSTVNFIIFCKDPFVLKLKDSVNTLSGGPCFIEFSPDGRFLVTANYGGGSISIIGIEEDGSLSDDVHLITYSGRGLDTIRQNQSRTHQITFSPEGKYMFVTDLGTDKIYIYILNEEYSKETGLNRQLINYEAGFNTCDLEPGSGPRHMCFHPDGHYAYLINELSGKVSVMSYYDGKLKLLQEIAADTTGAKASGDIHISKDGRYLYASNRRINDGIAIFSVNKHTGFLTKIGYQNTANHPRNFIFTPNGKYMLVACKNDNCVQIYKVNKTTGMLKNTGKEIKENSPVCLKF